MNDTEIYEEIDKQIKKVEHHLSQLTMIELKWEAISLGVMVEKYYTKEEIIIKIIAQLFY